MPYKNRIRILFAAVGTLFLVLGARLTVLHLNPSSETKQRLSAGRRLVRKLPAKRGRILDRSGNIFAVDIAARNLCADPQFIAEHGDLARICSEVEKLVPLSYPDLWKKLNRDKLRYVRIQPNMSEKRLKPLMEMKLKGLIFEKSFLRNYPKGTLGAHVVGYAKREFVSKAGVEFKTDKYLRGTDGRREGIKDGRRHEIYRLRTMDVLPQTGADVYLTLDQQVQHFTEKALDELVAKYHPQGAWAIVQNIKSGEILAMASWPTYNPNRHNDPHLPEEWKRNRAICFGYEPGSVMKAVIVASAIDGGYVSARDVFDCEKGRWVYGGRSLRDSHPEELLSVADILKKSSNIGAAKVALQMGPEKVYQSLKKFGFGARTGIDLPREESGILWSTKHWSKISITRLAMGHEINVTAMQMISAFSAIANDGVRMRPYVVSKVISSDGQTLFKNYPHSIGQPIRSETSKIMRRLLARVTQPGGTGTKAALKGYAVAGKTGTAQKVRPKKEGGGYYPHKYVSSFAGFLPVENPAVSIMVVADDPRGSYYGGTVCGPAFREIAKQTVRYLRISPQGFSPEYSSGLPPTFSSEEVP